MALPPYDFLISAPTDQLGTGLGTGFDYLNAFRSGQGIRNDIDYSDQPMMAVMPPPFTIGDNPDVISDMNLPEYLNFKKYMNERGAADLINVQNQVVPIDGGSDSKGIGEIILPPITGGNQGDEGGGIPTLRKSYTVGPTSSDQRVKMSSDPTAQLTGRGRLDPMGSGFYDTLNMIEARDPSSYKMSTFNKDFSPLGESGQISYDPDINPNIKKAFYESVYQEPEKQNFLQKGIGSIKDFFGKFSGGPKVQGTLGTRLSNRINNPGFQLPLQGVLSGFFKQRSPFNPDAKNYNPILEQQLNIAEAGDKVGYDEKSGLLKYSKNSVLSGQNAISGFGTNDYEKQLENFLEKSQGVFNKKYGDVDIEELMAKGYTVSELKKLNPTNKFDALKIKAATYKTKYINAALEELKPFKNKEYIEKKKQLKEQREAKKIQDELAAAAKTKDKAAALAAIKKQGKMDYNPNIHGPTNYGRDDQGNQSFDSGQGFGIGSDGGPVSNRTGRGRTGFGTGGIVTL